MWNANENSNRKKKRVGKERVEEALKQWFTKVKEKDTRVTKTTVAPKTQGSYKKSGKNDFKAIENWFQQWKKSENILFVKSHGEQGKTDHASARLWIHSDWLSFVTKYPPPCMLNVDETGFFSGHYLNTHVYVLKWKN